MRRNSAEKFVASSRKAWPQFSRILVLVIRMDRSGPAVAQALIGVQPRHLGPPGIAVNPLADCVGHENAVGRGFAEGSELGFALLKEAPGFACT